MKQADIDSYPIVLTAIEISEILKISKPTAYELMNRHDFPLTKIGSSQTTYQTTCLLFRCAK